MTSASRILVVALPRILLPPIMVIKIPLFKDDDTEFIKLAAIYAYAVNHATPGTTETQMQRIYNVLHGEENCVSIFGK